MSLILNNGAAPSTPAAGKTNQYASTVGETHVIDERGVDVNLTPNGKFNWMRNSGMWFFQRQAPGTLTTYSSVGGRVIAGADGWSVSNENASIQAIRVDTSGAPETGLAGRFYGSFTKITANGKIVLAQCLEGTDTNALRGSTVRVQIWAKGIVTASSTWRLALAQLTSAGAIDVIPNGGGLFITAFGAASTDPTLGANMAYIAPKAGITPDNGAVVGNAINITVTTAAWQRFGGVFDVPAGAKNLIVMLFSDAQVATTAGISLSQTSLTAGQAVQDWAPLSYDAEMRRVFRFYQKTFAVDTNPVTAAGVATGCLRCILGKAAATALAAQFQWRYPVNLRAAATTLTTYNPAAANAQVRQIGGVAADLTATATANSTEQSVDVTATGVAGGVIGDQCGVHVSADAEL